MGQTCASLYYSVRLVPNFCLGRLWAKRILEMSWVGPGSIHKDPNANDLFAFVRDVRQVNAQTTQPQASKNVRKEPLGLGRKGLIGLKSDLRPFSLRVTAGCGCRARNFACRCLCAPNSSPYSCLQYTYVDLDITIPGTRYMILKNRYQTNRLEKCIDRGLDAPLVF